MSDTNEKKTASESDIVNLPSDTIINKRDMDKPLVLETRHLGIDFGGLTAVDEFNIGVGASFVVRIHME